MATIKKNFGKFRVTLDVSMEDGEKHTDCHITKETRIGREYSASLACAMDTGFLTNAIYGDIKIESAIVDDIEEWAIENGY